VLCSALFRDGESSKYSGEAPTNFRSTSTSSCAAKVQHGDHDSPLLAA
jgi:hypothetical protein